MLFAYMDEGFKQFCIISTHRDEGFKGFLFFFDPFLRLRGGSDEVTPFASAARVWQRRRFKKPHGCDCESRMSMET